ncbi:FIG00858582: hypothetical protein [hydrothermal vent metagenome]|uniref:Uncharacterized protein n=1 Tax=hydrothermal vent metagenome TaxID=652676 RepID=A0A3B1AXS9_9ZZZZ
MLKNITPLVLLIAIISVISGCAQNTNYRTEIKLEQACNYVKAGDCAQAAIQYSQKGTDKEYHLGFVEFDDQGQLRKRPQLENVLDYFYPIAGKQDVLLVSFVHGWHHSARPGDNNVMKFRELLANLAEAEAMNSRKHGHSPRKVLGMYVGWRGDSITIPWVNGITFWDRKNTAHNVGSQGVAEVFLKLEEIVNVRMGMADEGSKDQHNSRLVILGHSFGGAVAFTALQQILTDRFIDSRAKKTFQGNANGFGDLVVLLNPAFEAMRFASLYDLSQLGCRRYFPTQLPKLAILTSEADRATSMAFPAGRFFSTMFEKHGTLERHYCSEKGEQAMLLDEGEADRTTVGHFETFRTHQLLPLPQAIARTADFDFQLLQQNWAKQKPAASLLFEATELQHLDRTRPLNPYLNIYVDETLIGDHNDIWGDEIISFVRDLIMISTMPQMDQ